MKNVKPIARYVMSARDDMLNVIPEVQERMAECDDPEMDLKFWRDYARHAIKEDYQRAFGALVYANVYEKTISNEEYELLVDEIFITWDRVDKAIWREIC